MRNSFAQRCPDYIGCMIYPTNFTLPKCSRDDKGSSLSASSRLARTGANSSAAGILVDMRELPIHDITVHEDNCVRRVPIFSGLTAAEQDLVATMARPRFFVDGELIHGAGEQTGTMFVVHSGSVKVSRLLPSGRKQLLRVIKPGDTLGEYAFLTGSAPEEEAQAIDEVRLCSFVDDDLKGLIDRYPGIAHRMLRNLGERLAQTEHQLTLNTQSVDVRIADYLLQQPLIRQSDPATSGMQVRLPLNKKDIASLLGTTPESFSRALSRLRAKGLIAIEDDVVTLEAPDELEALVSGDA